MNRKSVVETPTDKILDGIIVDIEKTTWRNIITAEKLHKFENPDDEILQVKYEVKVDDKVLKGEDTFRFYENPMSNSKLGKLLLKYDSLEIQKEIKVEFDGDGYTSIKLK